MKQYKILQAYSQQYVIPLEMQQHQEWMGVEPSHHKTNGYFSIYNSLNKTLIYSRRNYISEYEFKLARISIRIIFDPINSFYLGIRSVKQMSRLMTILRRHRPEDVTGADVTTDNI